MNFLSLAKKRYSVRNYQSKPVEKEKLNQILEAARVAPSAHNAQNWKFVVVQDNQIREQLAQAAGQSFIKQAPVVIAAVALDPGRKMAGGVPAYAVDLAIAVDHMTLAATAQGLGSCWIGAFNQQKVKEILEIPPDNKVVVLLPLGYPADKPDSKSRKALSEIVYWEKYS